jgi:hypothetical protein
VIYTDQWFNYSIIRYSNRNTYGIQTQERERKKEKKKENPSLPRSRSDQHDTSGKSSSILLPEIACQFENRKFGVDSKAITTRPEKRRGES